MDCWGWSRCFWKAFKVIQNNYEQSLKSHLKVILCEIHNGFIGLLLCYWYDAPTDWFLLREAITIEIIKNQLKISIPFLIAPAWMEIMTIFIAFLDEGLDYFWSFWWLMENYTSLVVSNPQTPSPTPRIHYIFFLLWWLRLPTSSYHRPDWSHVSRLNDENCRFKVWRWAAPVNRETWQADKLRGERSLQKKRLGSPIH